MNDTTGAAPSTATPLDPNGTLSDELYRDIETGGIDLSHVGVSWPLLVGAIIRGLDRRGLIAPAPPAKSPATDTTSTYVGGVMGEDNL